VSATETIGATFEPDDGRTEGWTHPQFAAALGQAFGRKVATVTMPRWALQLGTRVDRWWRKDGAKLTPDRVRYFCHPDWVARAERRPPVTLWRPKTGTFGGLKRTADWYRAEGWLG
jgi:hypothetical protein